MIFGWVLSTSMTRMPVFRHPVEMTLPRSATGPTVMFSGSRHGESFASWVDRMAPRNGCPPWAMVDASGLDVRASGDVHSLAYGIVATPETYRAIEAATGMSSEIIRVMHLEVFDGSVLDLAGVRVGEKESVRQVEGREWVQFFGSRVCPTCLAASGGAWLVWWKLG
ncbi:TniQ family protein [Nonomuraea sp. CA-143628]|uniref:TniQ family protein n=1 Tax=Nonomuraea sp. CA-143628 TaxID=3239997 RepID=UPI003D93B28F